MRSPFFVSNTSVSPSNTAVTMLIQSSRVGSSGSATPANDRCEQDEREPGIDWQNPDDELCEIVKDGAPFLHSGFVRGEVVVGQSHVGRLLRDVSAGDVHRHAHFDLFERGCVVDTIADNRDRIPAGLKCMPQAVSKKTSLSLKCAPPEAVERGSNSFHATTRG